MPSDVAICSKALLRLGDKAISSFSEGSSGPLCKEIFPELKLRILTSHPWRFNTIKSKLLNRTLIEPPSQYKYAYQLPPDMISSLPRTVWDSGFNQGRSAQFTGFNIFQDKLLTSAEKILIDYQIDVVADSFPIHVTNLTIYAMMAEIALPVTDQQTTATAAQIRAWGTPEERGKGGYFREAARIDSQGHPSQSIKNYPLVTVRHGGI